MSIRCFHVSDKPVEISATSASGIPLPAGNVVSPGVYLVFGANWDLSAEGLYWIKDYSNGSTAQIISYVSNFDALVQAISWLFCHGDTDNGLTLAQSLSAARTRTLVRTCGGTAPIAQSLLQSVGYQVRVVNGLTTEELESGDNGHTINEVWLNNQWVALDFDMKYRFYAADGVTPLGLLNLHDMIRSGSFPTLSPLSSAAGNIDPHFSYLWLAQYEANDPQYFYTREFGLLQYLNASGAYFDVMYEDQADLDAIARYNNASFHPMDRTTFLATYYAGAPAPGYHYGPLQNGTTGWGGIYSVLNMSNPLAAGVQTTTLGVQFNNPHSVAPFIARYDGASFTLAWKGAYATHNGGGYQDFACGFTPPADGAQYLPGFVGNLPGAPAEVFANGAGQRANGAASYDATAAAVGDALSLTIRSDAGTICTRWQG